MMSINTDRQSVPQSRYGVLCLVLCLAITSQLTGCAIVANTPRGGYDRETGSYNPDPRASEPVDLGKWRGFQQVGQVSYYAAKFDGKKTASGEIYESGGLTAAHRELPFGVRVRVTHLKSGKSVMVRVNDRGPFVKGRILDVSREAADQLGLVQTGVAEARIEVVEP
jgi:rare lipoprotein A